MSNEGDETDDLPFSLNPSIIIKSIKTSDNQAHKLENNYIKKDSNVSVVKSSKYKDLVANAHTKGIQDHYKLKKEWSKIVLDIMIVMVVFQMVLIICVGVDLLDYRGYDWLLPTLMIQYFAQIVTLAWLIVKNLYTDINK